MKKHQNRSANRRNQRKANAFNKKLNSGFIKLTEEFASKYFEIAMDTDIPKQEKEDKYFVELFNNFDKRWRYYVRYLLHNNRKDITLEVDKRQSVLNSFNEFALEYMEKTEKRDTPENVIERYGIEKVSLVLNSMGVNTQAKTKAGLQKRVDALKPDDVTVLIKGLHGEF